MKKSLLVLGAIVLISLTSCKKTEVTATDVNADSAATAVVVDNDSLPITSDSTIDRTDDAAERAVDATGNAIEEGANDVKDAAKDATDGDGDITK